jgi:hypothetical protein
VSKSTLHDDPTAASIDAAWSEPPPSAARPRHRSGTPSRPTAQPGLPVLLTVAEAAGTLRTTVEALRARLRRAQVLAADGSVVAPLGQGIVGIKLGANTWRVRFDAK